MNKRKLSLIICSCVCAVLMVAVVGMGLYYQGPGHKHTLSADKTYHICQDRIYYTQQCKDGCSVNFETKASLTDVFASATSSDKIVLDEDVALTEETFVKAFVDLDVEPEEEVVELDININLDLNGFVLSTDIDEIEHNSMFAFNANRGTVNFKVSNGKISSHDTAYIFRFKNHAQSGDNIKLTLDNVECEVYGIKATPLFMSECVNVEVNAVNSKFMSHTTGTQTGDYGVGAFINSDSEFNFTNCYFEGGDAMYVKEGTVNLTGCKLANVGLAEHPAQGGSTFSAVGACLTADSHTTTTGRSVFDITIVNCEMLRGNSSKMIYVIETAQESGLQLGVDDASVINVISCKFEENPRIGSIPQYDNVKYPNGTPEHNGVAWVCGNVTLSE